MRTVPCHCDHLIEIDLNDEIDLSARPEYYQEILDGTFLTVVCPACGNRIKPELEVRLKDPEKNLDVLFLPEARRSDFMNHRIDTEAKSLLIGFPELVERVRLTKDGIDPGTVEILKFFLKKKLENDEVFIFYTKTEEDRLVFRIIGLREGEIALTGLPVKVYRDTLASLDEKKNEELYKTILTPPYVSVNKVSIQEDG
ncbi:MAG: CpXC domain-containing protein [Spirochaetales bacterium]|jgi:hypothetical protein|nr:CpXC domain-containing protein [Spirochaetales bacterium]